MATCYRHPDRETGVSCSNCGKPICPDCMTPTPVGMRCPECSAQRTKVHTMRSTTGEPRVTVALIVACAVIFLATNGFSGGSGKLWTELYLDGPDIHFGHDYWRLVTSGFLHSGQRIPTGVGVMQSGQIGLPQLEQETAVSRSGWR